MKYYSNFVLIIFILFGLFNFGNCLPDYETIIPTIVQASLNNTQGYARLQYMADTFGIRLTGTQGLANMIDWAAATIRQDAVLAGLTLEPVPVRHWVRSDVASLTLTTPHTEPMTLGVTALGGSVGTGNTTLVGQPVVVRSFDEAHAMGAAGLLRGKIVVWNQPWQGYGAGSEYRVHGASVAASYGAVASLVRSVTDFSLYTLHTGMQQYDRSVPRIPAAAITVEDAQLFQRYQDRKFPFTLALTLGCYEAPEALSYNIVAQLQGSGKPEDELVVIGGHIDAWSRGAQDDGGAFVAAWEALNVLASLGLRPRRSIRLVGWTSEEWGGQGGEAYTAAHLEEVGKTVFAMESDMGIFFPDTLHFQGSNESLVTLQELSDILNPWYNISVSNVGGVAEDVQPLANLGVPSASLVTVGDPSYGSYWYFYFYNYLYFFFLFYNF